MKYIIKGGRVINPARKFDAVADVLVEDGKIKAVGENLAADGAEVYDATGKVVVPGLVDLHVHFREPGQEAKEDFESGSKAAAAGGFTTVCTMPNTKPVVDNAALVRSLEKRAEDVAKVHVNPAEWFYTVKEEKPAAKNENQEYTDDIRKSVNFVKLYKMYQDKTLWDFCKDSTMNCKQTGEYCK